MCIGLRDVNMTIVTHASHSHNYSPEIYGFKGN